MGNIRSPSNILLAYSHIDSSHVFQTIFGSRISNLISVIEKTFGDETTWSSSCCQVKIWFDILRCSFGLESLLQFVRVSLVFPSLIVIVDWIAIALDLCGSHKFFISSSIKLSIWSRFNISSMVLIKVVKLIVKEKFITFWYIFFEFNDVSIFTAPNLICFLESST